MVGDQRRHGDARVNNLMTKLRQRSNHKNKRTTINNAPLSRSKSNEHYQHMNVV